MLKTRLMTGLASVALLVPQLTLAATPQQMLDRATAASVTDLRPRATTVDMNFNYKYRPVVRGEPAVNVKLHLIATGEEFPRGSTLKVDADQRFRVEAVEVAGAPEFGGATMRWQDPVSFEMKTIGQTFYVRVASVSGEVRAMLNQLQIPGLNLDQVIGRWLQVDIDGLQEALKEALPMAGEVRINSQQQMDLVRQLEPILRKPGLLRATRLESRVTRNGVTYARVRFQVQPKFWNEIEAFLRKQVETELASLKASDRRAYNQAYAQQTKELRDMMNLIRKEVAKAQFVAVVNESTGEIERVEVAGKSVQPSYSEQYVGRRLVKRLVAYMEFHYSAVVATRRIADRQVTPPAEYVTLPSLIDMLKRKMEESMAMPMEMEAAPTTP